MKKGFVYVEALVASLITVILIFSISRLTFQSTKIVQSGKEKGIALDIVRSTASLYKINKLEEINSEQINLSSTSDIYNYIENRERKGEGEVFTMHLESAIEEGIPIMKIKVVSNNKMFDDLYMVVTK